MSVIVALLLPSCPPIYHEMARAAVNRTQQPHGVFVYITSGGTRTYKVFPMDRPNTSGAGAGWLLLTTWNPEVSA